MKRALVRFGLLMGCLAVGGSAAADERKKEQFIIKFETVASRDSPWSKTYKRFVKRAHKDSHGRIRFKPSFGSSAGEISIARRCIDGSIQACGVTVGALSAIVKDLSVLELPFLFLSSAEADKILDGPALPPVKKILAAHGLVFYAWSENGWRSFGSKSKPIRTPADLKGLRMRAQQNPLHSELYRSFNAIPVPVKAPDVVGALEKDRVDGFDQSLVYLTAASWHKQIKYFTLTRHIYQPAIVAYNKKYLEKLPRDLQKILVRSSAEVARFNRKEIRKIYDPLIKNLEQQGIKVIRLTPVQRIPFIFATKKAHIKVYKRASRRARKLLDVIYRAKQRMK